MTKGLLTTRGALTLLCVWLVAAGSVPAAESDLSFVPADASAIITARLADLSGKLGLKESSGHPWLAAFQEEFGMSIDKVERCTMVFTDVGQNTDDACFIIRTTQPTKREAILKGALPGAKKVRIQGKLCYVAQDQQGAIYFASDRIILMAPTVKHLESCLKQSAGESAYAKDLEQALKLAGQHDFVAWGRTLPPPKEQPAATTTALNLSLIPGKKGDCPPAFKGTVPFFSRTKSTKGRMLTVARTAVPGSRRAFCMPPADGQNDTLDFTALGAALGLESALLTVDVGNQLVLEMRLQCVDAGSARKTESTARSLVELARGIMLAGAASTELQGVLGVDIGDLPALPTTLMRKAEKGLARARIRVEGDTVPVSITIPVNAKTLKTESVALLQLLDMEAAPNGVISPPAVAPVPPPHFPELLPNPGPVPSVRAPRGVSPVPTWSAPTATLPTPTPGQLPSPGQWPAPVTNLPALAAAPQTTATMPACPIEMPGCIRPVVATGIPVASAPEAPSRMVGLPPIRLKLAVANVKKEPVLLFSMSESGQLTFMQRLSAGEATDLQTNLGQRWVAICTDRPAGECFTVAQTTTTWLLR